MRRMLLVLLLFQWLSLATALSVRRWRSVLEKQEFVADLQPNKMQRLVIARRYMEQPMYMYVTPCGGTVHWRLYSFDGDFDEIRYEELFTDHEGVKLIAGESEQDRMQFYSSNLKHDNLLLVVSSSSRASASIFVASTQDEMDEFYPPLPEDTRLGLAIGNNNEETQNAIVNWKTAKTVREAYLGRYRICAVVSRSVPDWSFCDRLDDGVESIHCVPSANNSIQIEKIRRGRPYHVTVFVRDLVHGSTSVYGSLEVKLKNAPQPVKKSVDENESKTLIDGSLMVVKLTPKKGSSQLYQYSSQDRVRVKRRGNRQVMFVVHACSGYVRIVVYRNGRILKRSEPFTGFRRFLVMNLRGGGLKFEVVNDEDRAKSVKLWASTRPDKSPYPMLPDDTSVKVIRRSCGSVSLQWLRASDKHAEYCIYFRRETANFFEHLNSAADNLCEGGMTSSVLIGCYSHRGPLKNDVTGLIETTLNGLSPSATYRFDLMAVPLRKRKPQALPYRTVWVRTQNC